MRARQLASLCLVCGLAFGGDDPKLAAQDGATQSPCDPNLHGTSENPWGYKLRGDRCEGIYIQPVGGATLLTASFTRYFEDFDPVSLDTLTVEWSSPVTAATRLRAYALREKLYYQMDAVVAPEKTTYRWPGAVLSSLHLAKRDVGVIGFTELRIGSDVRTLYLPLRVRGKSHEGTSGYQMVLVPGSELKEVFLSLAKVDADGEPRVFSISDRPLRRGYYPAERGVLIDIPDPGPPGIYYVEIGATTRYGGPVTQQIWFYHGAT